MLVYDHTQLVEPNLLIPGKKPVGPVKIDPYALSCPIRFCMFPERRKEIIGSRVPVNFLNTGVSIIDEVGVGDYFHTPNMSTNFSVVNTVRGFTVDGSVGTDESFTIVLHILTGLQDTDYHYIAGLGSNLAIASKNAGGSGQWALYIGSSTYGAGSTLAANSEYVLVVRRKGADISFFKNGIKESEAYANSIAAGGTSLTWNSYTPAGGYGFAGYGKSITFIDGALSDSECIDLTSDPYQFLISAS